MDPIDAQIRQVFFFDTPDLALNTGGRRGSRPARAAQGRRHRRQAAPGRARRAAGQAPPVARLRRRGRRDARRLRLLRLAEGRPAGAGAVKECVGGARPLRKLFSKEQRAFFAEHAPEGVALDDLADPRPDLRAQAQVHAGTSRASSSRRCGSIPTSRASSSCRPSACRPRRSRPSPRPAPTSRGTASTSAGEQQTKTRRALEFFAARMQKQ